MSPVRPLRRRNSEPIHRSMSSNDLKPFASTPVIYGGRHSQQQQQQPPSPPGEPTSEREHYKNSTNPNNNVVNISMGNQQHIKSYDDGAGTQSISRNAAATGEGMAATKGSLTPVGVTIAFRRQKKLEQEEQEGSVFRLSSSVHDNNNNNNNNNTNVHHQQEQEQQGLIDRPIQRQSSFASICSTTSGAGAATGVASKEKPKKRNSFRLVRRRSSKSRGMKTDVVGGGGSGVGIGLTKKEEKRLQRLWGGARRIIRVTAENNATMTILSKITPKKRAYKKPVSSFTTFLEGVSLYMACLLLPSFVGYVYQNYSYESLQEAFMEHIAMISGHNHHNVGEGNGPSQQWNDTYDPTPSSFFYLSPESTKDMSLFTATAYSYGYWAYGHAASRVCPIEYDPDSYTAMFCDPYIEQFRSHNNMAISPAESIYSREFITMKESWKCDVIVVAVLALALALVRYMLVRAYAPKTLKSKESLHAMVRCKSIHLLSSDYSSTLTPASSSRKLISLLAEQRTYNSNTGDGDNDNGLPLSPLLFPVAPVLSDENSSTGHDQRLGLRIDGDDEKSANGAGGRGGIVSGSSLFLPSTVVMMSGMSSERPGEYDSVAADNEYYHDDLDDDNASAVGIGEVREGHNIGGGSSIDRASQGQVRSHNIYHDSPGDLRAPTKNQSDTLVDAAATGEITEQSDDYDDDGTLPFSFSRLYAAPRFATAVFRFLYSATASFLAFYWFGTSDFWPKYLMGHGSTAKCWDLNGLAVTMDSDFDHRNRVLKHYFLWQASYHLHSWAFDLLLATLTLIKRGSSTNPSSPVGTSFKARKAYLRSLLHHFISIVLIAVAYVFSSIRRLATIAMFAFDVSSCFLHLLQICLNADDPKIKNRKVISIVYYGTVLPSFILMRGLVWPLLWWSATTESQNWFRQLENTLFPRAALFLQAILQLLILLCMVLTAVYFRRLCRQPHLQRMLQPGGNGMNPLV